MYSHEAHANGIPCLFQNHSSPRPPLKKNQKICYSELMTQEISAVRPYFSLQEVTPSEVLDPKDREAKQVALDLINFVQQSCTSALQSSVEAVDEFGQNVFKTVTHNKLPTLAQFCRSYGITQSELKRLAENFPDTIGRAYEFALDTIEDLLAERTLEGRYHPAAVSFIAPNITRFRNKQQIENVITRPLSSVLDEIEGAKKPAAPSV